MKKLGFLVISILCFLPGCRQTSEPHRQISGNQYAKGFSISEEKGFRKLTVFNPWGKARNIVIDYYLVDKSRDIPDFLTNKNVIRTPVENIICLSTTHLAFLDKLGEIDRVTGVSGGAYVSNPYILKEYQEGRISDVGYGQNLNFEEIIKLSPDVVMVYGVDSEITGFLSKFNDLAIPSIIIAEYLETSPLGKTEWIKFTGALLGKENLADSVFKEIFGNYAYLTKMADKQQIKPTVMMGLPYRDSWWVPGGDSYMAHLISDAGGNYLGKENPSRESFVISFEEALIWASKADVWLNVGTVSSKDEILDINNRFDRFEVFRKGRIYNNNARISPGGGIDFWESGVVAPDVILSDLISIFHPGLPERPELFYYKPVE